MQVSPDIHVEFVERAKELRAKAAAITNEKERAALEREAQSLDEMLAVHERLLIEIDRLGERLRRQRAQGRRQLTPRRKRRAQGKW